MILHHCSLLLPGSTLPAGLTSLLAKVEASVPTREPPVCPHALFLITSSEAKRAERRRVGVESPNVQR